MEIKKIEQLIQLVKEHNLHEIEVEEENVRIRIKATGGNGPEIWAGLSMLPAALKQGAPQIEARPLPQPEPENKKVAQVKSPMVGTFYRSPGPDKPMYVDVGSEVKKGDTLCIIEAMKLMNEIESTVDGKITAILVDNAKPVEFNQPLFEIEPKE